MMDETALRMKMTIWNHQLPLAPEMDHDAVGTNVSKTINSQVFLEA